jgi:hypothetical protein
MTTSEMRAALIAKLESNWTGEVSSTRRHAWNEALDVLLATPSVASPQEFTEKQERIAQEISDEFCGGSEAAMEAILCKLSEFGETDQAMINEVLRRRVASPQDDPDPWIRPCPRIYSVQSDGSQIAYFNRQSAEQFISERKEPEKFKLIEYVPADGTERTRENVRGYVAGFKAAEEYAAPVGEPGRTPEQEEFEAARQWCFNNRSNEELGRHIQELQAWKPGSLYTTLAAYANWFSRTDARIASLKGAANAEEKTHAAPPLAAPPAQGAPTPQTKPTLNAREHCWVRGIFFEEYESTSRVWLNSGGLRTMQMVQVPKEDCIPLQGQFECPVCGKEGPHQHLIDRKGTKEGTSR